MKPKVVLSAVTSFFFGVISYFLLQYLEIQDALLLSLLCGFMVYIILLPFLIIYGKIMDKKYAEIEKEISSPVFYKTNGNFYLGNGRIKNGNIYFCEEGIVCVCLEEKPHTLDEILLQDIERYQFDDIHFNIFTKDGRLFLITMPDVKKVMNALKEKKWVVNP